MQSSPEDGDLNRDVFGLPDDGKVIILSDSDEEEEHVREEITADVDAAPSFATRMLASTAFATDTDEALKGVQNDNSDDCTPGQEADGGSNGGDEADSP
jgi:5S rRNA maturation endonuclease (ribonuclease M5)